jgi:hypothetical protein
MNINTGSCYDEWTDLSDVHFYLGEDRIVPCEWSFYYSMFDTIKVEIKGSMNNEDISDDFGVERIEGHDVYLIRETGEYLT